MPSRQAEYLLDRLIALDDAIGRHRRALERSNLTDGELESHRVALAMLEIDRARTVTKLRATGWRPGTPAQGGLL